MDITWKHIVLGFVIEEGQGGVFRNIVISIVAFSIYKTKILQELTNMSNSLTFSVKKEIVQLLNLLQYVKTNDIKKMHAYFKKFSQQM